MTFEMDAPAEPASPSPIELNRCCEAEEPLLPLSSLTLWYSSKASSTEVSGQTRIGWASAHKLGDVDRAHVGRISSSVPLLEMPSTTRSQCLAKATRWSDVPSVVPLLRANDPSISQ